MSARLIAILSGAHYALNIGYGGLHHCMPTKALGRASIRPPHFMMMVAEVK